MQLMNCCWNGGFYIIFHYVRLQHQYQYQFPGASSTTAGIIRSSATAADGIARIYEVEDPEGNIRQIPTRRIYLAKQDLVERHSCATGRVPD